MVKVNKKTTRFTLVTDLAVLVTKIEAADARLKVAIFTGHGVSKADSELATLEGLYRAASNR